MLPKLTLFDYAKEAAAEHFALVTPAGRRMFFGAGAAFFAVGLCFSLGVDVSAAHLGAILVSVPVVLIGCQSLAPSFRRRLLGKRAEEQREIVLEKQRGIFELLSPKQRERFLALKIRIARMGDLFKSKTAVIRPGEFLLWTYLKLLLALDHLLQLDADVELDALNAKYQAAEGDLARSDLSAQHRSTLEETLNLIQHNLHIAQQRRHRIAEVESELQRIELKASLLHERAAHSAAVGESLRAVIHSELVTTVDVSPQLGPMVDEVDGIFAEIGEY
jgi:hypothetical protein